MHGHSTKDFQTLYWVKFAPLFGKYLAHMYQKADFVITPVGVFLKAYCRLRVTTLIIAVSNGIDLKKYQADPKRKGF